MGGSQAPGSCGDTFIVLLSLSPLPPFLLSFFSTRGRQPNQIHYSVLFCFLFLSLTHTQPLLFMTPSTPHTHPPPLPRQKPSSPEKKSHVTLSARSTFARGTRATMRLERVEPPLPANRKCVCRSVGKGMTVSVCTTETQLHHIDGGLGQVG